MKRLRIFLTTILLLCSATVCSFAETAPQTEKKEPPWEIIAIVVVLVLIAINEIKRAKKRKNDRSDDSRTNK